MPLAKTVQKDEHSIERNAGVVEYLPEEDEIRLDVDHEEDREVRLSIEGFRRAANMIQNGESGVIPDEGAEVVGGIAIRPESTRDIGVAISALLAAEGGGEAVLERINAV